MDQQAGGELTISLAGDIDADTAAQLIGHLRRLPLDGATLDLVTLDLRSVEFLDATGISTLVKLRHRAGARHIPFRMRNVRQELRRALHIGGLAEYLGVDEGLV